MARLEYLNVQDLKDSIEYGLKHDATTKKERELIFNTCEVMGQNIGIDDPEWDDFWQWLNEIKTQSMKSHKVSPKRKPKTNAKNMVGKLPNFKKNFKRIC